VAGVGGKKAKSKEGRKQQSIFGSKRRIYRRRRRRKDFEGKEKK